MIIRDKKRNLAMATDFYQFSVANVYRELEVQDTLAVFDVFFRSNPFNGGYTVFAGLENIVDYIRDLSFTEEDIAILHENHPELTDNFLDYLRHFKFTGEIYAVPEGTIVFPQEPLVRVKAPLIQAQIIETAMLAIVNHEALIATKASRVCGSAQGDGVLEFGLRRAHGVESGLYGARAAIIGGCVGTSNVEAEYRYNTISKGTISHAFIMSFDEEIEAFRAYAKLNPLNVTVLADTYDTLRSGVPNAIKLFSELKDEGGLKGMYGIRLDSGDLSYLSKTARQMLDSAGFPGAKITASNDLDEYSILNLKNDGAKIDIWGVGTKMITAFDCPSLGGVYKLAQLEADGKVTPKMKISDDPFKITNPSYKKIVRLYLNSTHKATADLIMLDEEVLDTTKPIKIFHPYFSYKQRIVSDFYTKDLLECIFKDGELVYELPELEDIKAYHLSQKEQFWNEILRINGPEEYHVDISNKLYDIKTEFIHKHNFKE